MRSLAAAIALLALLGGRLQAAPDAKRERAKLHSQKGAALYAQGKFSDALKEYQAAYDLLPLPDLLFNIAQAYRQMGDKEAALDHYRRYLDLVPEGGVSDEARKQMTELLRLVYRAGATPKRVEPTSPPQAKPESKPVVEPPVPQPRPAAPVLVAEAPPRPRPLVRRPWFWVALGGVAAVAGAAIALGVVYGGAAPQPPNPSYGKIPGN